MDDKNINECIDFNANIFIRYELKNYSLPVNFWKEFPAELLPVVNDQSQWKSFKVLNDDCSINDVGFSSISNACGGVYSFVVISNVFTHNQKTLLYIGVATFSDSENLRSRVSSYKKFIRKELYTRDRPFLSKCFHLWKDYLYCVYHEMPGEDTKSIEKLEKELIWAMEPPCNPDQEGYEARSKGRKMAFGG